MRPPRTARCRQNLARRALNSKQRLPRPPPLRIPPEGGEISMPPNLRRSFFFFLNDPPPPDFSPLPQPAPLPTSGAGGRLFSYETEKSFPPHAAGRTGAGEPLFPFAKEKTGDQAHGCPPPPAG